MIFPKPPNPWPQLALAPVSLAAPPANPPPSPPPRSLCCSPGSPALSQMPWSSLCWTFAHFALSSKLVHTSSFLCGEFKGRLKLRLHLFGGILLELPFWITNLPSWPLPHFISVYPPWDCKLLRNRLHIYLNFVPSEYTTKKIPEMFIK